MNKKLYSLWTFFINFSFLILLLPIFILSIVILIPFNKFYNNGPLFFVQNRLGLNGKIFKLYKFRTMYIDAEKEGPRWSYTNDPRITKLGKFLRKSRIDELPQLVNILFFEINLIGPRAERPEMRDIIIKNISNFNERLKIKPGITGLAQVTSGYGSNINDMKIKIKYDIHYIKNRSILLDITIIMKTIKSIVNLIGI
jgi:lipopolysaccharide/colanic/teichoic acid biosynthesis glycosyltransferase